MSPFNFLLDLKETFAKKNLNLWRIAFTCFIRCYKYSAILINIYRIRFQKEDCCEVIFLIRHICAHFSRIFILKMCHFVLKIKLTSLGGYNLPKFIFPEFQYSKRKRLPPHRAFLAETQQPSVITRLVRYTIRRPGTRHALCPRRLGGAQRGVTSGKL